MRISWFSNAPFTKTGYGNQTHLFVPRIQALGHDISVSAYYGLQGSILSADGPKGPILIYPAGYTSYGEDIWSVNAHNFEADVCISLMDAWVFQPSMNPHHIPWVPWFPVDMEPLPRIMKEKLSQATRRIVFSKFGLQVVNDAGLDAYYIPHGVDTALYAPMDREKARSYEMINLPQDRFIVGMVAANKGNPSRKAFQQQIEAFAELHKKHDDAFLYLHTCKAERGEHGGVNLPEFLDFLGLKEEHDYAFCDQYINVIGFPGQHMAMLYNAFDVHMLVSMGEGFGIPTLEAQACGCPVITSGWTASDELCFSGWKVEKYEAEKVWTPLAAYQYQPHAGAIAERLEAAYQVKDHQDYRDRAREGALRYDADRIAEKYWKPTLENIESVLPKKLAVKP